MKVCSISLCGMLVALVLTVNLALPSVALADSQVMLQVKVEPAYPIAGQDAHLTVLAKDRQGRPLSKAQVVATAWMDRVENPGMPEMVDSGSSRTAAVRITAVPQKNPGEYTVASALPMDGRWRIQVWVSSPGATGKADVELNVLSTPSPQGTNWIVVSTFIVLLAGITGAILWRRRDAIPLPSGRGSQYSTESSLCSPKNETTDIGSDLLHNSVIGRLLKSRCYPVALQIPVFAVFAAILYFLFAASASAHDNLGSVLVWIVWWPLLPLILLLFGRFWCAVCPMSGLSDLVQRLVGQRRVVPRPLKRWGLWLVLGAFLIITWLDSILRIVDSPRNTAYLFLAVIFGVVLCGLLFERRAWCRYLCFIGGMSSNYAMSSMLELRGDAEVCGGCRSFDCVRGNDRAAGCPMFEFPRTMESNRHCNLCGKCIKSCSKDALHLKVRFPAEELWNLRRRRWEEAVLAAALLGIVAIQTVVMLDVWDGFQAALRGVGIESFPLAFTVAFLGALALCMVAVAAASAISGRLSGAGFSSDMVRYAYALIPLGLAVHLGHNLNHLLGEALSIAKAALALVGFPLNLHPALVSTSTIQLMQYTVLALGAILAGLVAIRLGPGSAPSLTADLGGQNSRASSIRPLIVSLPHLILILGTSLVFLWMFSQTMVPRMQMSAAAHDDVASSQIEKAKGSVREFVGRDIDLTYVHLEEHGYRDIILKSGQDYYFVDSANNMVVSTFSERITTSSKYRVSKGDAERIALDFALKHYPGFFRNNLQPEQGPEESSPFIGGYVFKWRQYLDRVPTPNTVKVITDNVGRVGIYSARDVQVTVPTTPMVSQQQALRIAEQALDLSPAKESISLDIGPELTGRQMLRWTIRLEGQSNVSATPGSGASAEIVIDALTGEVTSILDWG